MNHREKGIPHQLFTPLRIGSMRLKNRIVMAPMGIGPARKGFNAGHVAMLKAFVTARAQGGAALIVLSGFVPDPGLKSVLSLHEGTTAEEMALLGEVADAGHEAGARMGIQLNHPGRQVMGEHKSGSPLVAPSPIPWSRRAAVPRELCIAEIEQLVERFAVAAGLVKAAGFDMVEIHGAHGMLLNQFFSARSNKRTDEYGGDLTGRTRFAVRVVEAIKHRVGREFPLCCRMNGSDYIPGGVTIEEAKSTALILEKAGVDLISVSAGVYGSKPSSLPNYQLAKGCFVPLAEAVKKTVHVPVMAVGRIADPWLAEEVLSSGKADLIGMCRALIADPELPKKAMGGRADEIRQCIACNQCIERADMGLILACVTNPDAGRESQPAPARAPNPKQVMIVGGGLSGLEAARVAALKGHHVTLYEEQGQLGGQWLLAALAPCKQDFKQVIDCLSKAVRDLGVTVNLNTAVTPDLVREFKPDVVILATGAMPATPPVPGIGRDCVVGAWDVLRCKSEVGQCVLVMGGGSVGLETAESLVLQGRQVTLVEMREEVGVDMVRSIRSHLVAKLTDLGVKIHTSTKVEEIGQGSFSVSTPGGRLEWKRTDTVVLATGSKSRNEMATDIAGIVREVYVIGDAAQPANGLAARLSGLETGLKV